MRVGVPAEIKNNEDRVAVTPAIVDQLRRRGHEVIVEAGAGEGSRISDADFSVPAYLEEADDGVRVNFISPNDAFSMISSMALTKASMPSSSTSKGW